MSKFKFNVKASKFRREKGRILDLMANNAVIEFKVNAFDKKGLDGDRWKPNQKQDGRQQLVKTGRMRGSIRTLKKSVNSRVIGSDVPYAVYQNAGTKHLPKRKFIGNSKALEKRNKGLLIREISKIV